MNPATGHFRHLLSGTRALVLLALLLISFTLGVFVGKGRIPFIREERRWAIGIYEGPSPFQLASLKGHKNPVLTAEQVTDVRAQYLADPFMLKHGSDWYMFFEVMNSSTSQGDIGLATSTDAVSWNYQQIVLDEPYHLSYPYVFQSGSDYYMIPESGAANEIRLYRATNFPTAWEFVKTLLTGSNFVDSSIFQFEGRWWLFTTSNDDKNEDNNLRLFFADDLMGPWIEHPSSPVIRGNDQFARSAGRVLVLGSRIIRYTQDSSNGYGRQVRAFQITELTPSTFKEELVSDQPVIAASGNGWNKYGMHQVDAQLVAKDRWVACVDGRGPQTVFGFGK